MGNRLGLLRAITVLASVALTACASSQTDSGDASSVGGAPGGGATGSNCAAFSNVITGASKSSCANGLNIELTCDAVPGSSRDTILAAGQRSTTCCGLSYPYYCPTTVKCYATAAEAAAACGATVCGACVNLYGKCTQLCPTGQTLNETTCSCRCSQTCPVGKYQDISCNCS